jgi:hypothetical protein
MKHIVLAGSALETTFKRLLADTTRSIVVSALMQRIKGATETTNTADIVCGQMR